MDMLLDIIGIKCFPICKLNVVGEIFFTANLSVGNCYIFIHTHR